MPYCQLHRNYSESITYTCHTQWHTGFKYLDWTALRRHTEHGCLVGPGFKWISPLSRRRQKVKVVSLLPYRSDFPTIENGDAAHVLDPSGEPQ